MSFFDDIENNEYWQKIKREKLRFYKLRKDGKSVEVIMGDLELAEVDD